MQSFQDRLGRRFRKQHQFTVDYSPLTSRLCLLFSRWLEKSRQPFTELLLDAAVSRTSFEVPMLLCAGLHYHVLRNTPAAGGLREYYPSVGGRRNAEHPQLEQDLEQAVPALRHELHRFIRTANVQTNETARGICWLLPLLYTPWREIDLVELGASAGLNLMADQYCYRLQDENSIRSQEIGRRGTDPFLLRCNHMDQEPPVNDRPEVITRTGCDKHPFPLDSREDELLLTSFIWPDQEERMNRLAEGIRINREMKLKGKGAELHEANLPDDLPLFLRDRVDVHSRRPLVIFNTYLTNYLDKQKGSLREVIENWAGGLSREVLWFQMELQPKDLPPPSLGWVLWQADVWYRGKQHGFHLAWAHPHGTGVRWLPGMTSWSKFWNER